MTLQEAKKIGRVEGIGAAFIGCVLFFYFTGIADFDLNSIWHVETYLWFGLVFSFGYYFGSKAATQILIEKKNYLIVGPVIVIEAFFKMTLLCMLVILAMSFFKAPSTFDASFTFYILYLILSWFIMALIPSLIIGLWLGWRIKRRV